MTWSLNTGAPYHTQDTSYYCGAAVAMTVLAEIGVPHSQLDQDVLYASNHAHNHNAAWYTDCYGLQYTLVNRKPASFGNTFVVHKRLNELDGTRDVVYTLRTYGVAPCVLVFGCAHWNTVIGAQTNTDPAFGAYTVDGFWINNPVWYDTPPPPPHGAADSCGSGGAHGIASEFITYSTWQSTYFTGCAFDDPGGATQWISVCDPDERSIESPTGRADRQRANGRRLLEPKQIGGLAERGIREYELAEAKLSAGMLRAGRVGAPQLVLRLDRRDSWYYLAPWESSGRTLGFAQVDARFGTFASLQVLDRPVRTWLTKLDAVRRLVDNKRFELADKLGAITVRPNTYCISPTLVWKPCRESYSPHLPFFQLTAGNHSLYVRIDGQVFTHLTPPGPGS